MSESEITWHNDAMAELDRVSTSYEEMLSDIATMIATDAGRTEIVAGDVALAAVRAIAGSSAAEQWNVKVERAQLRIQRDALLAACEALLAICKANVYPISDRPDHPWAKVVQAEAAIAKARGEGT